MITIIIIKCETSIAIAGIGYILDMPNMRNYAYSSGKRENIKNTKKKDFRCYKLK